MPVLDADALTADPLGLARLARTLDSAGKPRRRTPRFASSFAAAMPAAPAVPQPDQARQATAMKLATSRSSDSALAETVAA